MRRVSPLRRISWLGWSIAFIWLLFCAGALLADPLEPGWQPPAPTLTRASTYMPAGVTARLGGSNAPLAMHAFSADGKLLAVSDWLHLYILDGRTGRLHVVIEGESLGTISRTMEAGKVISAMPGIHAAAFSPDGSVLAGGGATGQLWFWDVKTGKQIGKTHNDGVRWLRFLPDGKHVLVCGANVRLWDVATQHPVRTFEAPRDKTTSMNVTCAALSPDAKLVAASDGRTLFVWNFADAKLQHAVKIDSRFLHSVPLDPHNGARALVFSDDSSRVIVNPAGGNRLYAFEVATGRIVADPVKDEIPQTARALSFSDDGRTMAWTLDNITGGFAGGYGPTLFVGDVARDNVILRRDVRSPASFVLSRDGRLLAVSEASGDVYVLDATTGKRSLTILEAPTPVVGVCFQPSGDRILSLTSDGMLHDWQINGSRELRRRQLPLAAKEIPYRFSPDGQLVAVVGDEGNLRMLDIEGRELWKVDRTMRLASLEPLLSSKSEFGPPPRPRHSLEFSADGRSLIGVESGGHRFTVWDAQTGKVRCQSSNHVYQTAALSPDGNRLATSFVEKKEQTLIVGETASGKGLQQVRLANKWPRSAGQEVTKTIVVDCLWSPDGASIAVLEEAVVHTYPNRMHFNGHDGAARKLHLWTPTLAGEPRVLVDDGYSMVFSPDGKFLAYGHSRYSLGLIDLATGKKRRTTQLGALDATTLRFSPDGRTIAAAGTDGSTVLWDVRKLLELPSEP